jgi:hypothetical protein
MIGRTVDSRAYTVLSITKWSSKYNENVSL